MLFRSPEQGCGLVPEQGFGVVYDAFAGVVVGIGEEDVPARGQGQGVDCEAMVLRRDETAACSFVDARLVVTTVTVPRDKHTNRRTIGSTTTLYVSWF